MSKLDDLLARKKSVAPILDLSRNIAQTKDDFKRLMEKVPDYKMRPVRVKAEDIKIKEKDYSFNMSKKEMKKLIKCGGNRQPSYVYVDPIPSEMKDIALLELCEVQIDWKMLTVLRPKSKQEEELFSRIVDMGKLQLKTAANDQKKYTLDNYVRKVKNKSGIVENSLVTCIECGEEMCTGRNCKDVNYDLYARVEVKSPDHKRRLNIPNKVKNNNNKKNESGAKIKIRKKSKKQN